MSAGIAQVKQGCSQCVVYLQDHALDIKMRLENAF